MGASSSCQLCIVFLDLNFCQNNKGVCKNHGKCENVQSSNNQAYKCVCPPGFRGDHCEMIQRDCLIHGCQNSGECTQHLDGQVWKATDWFHFTRYAMITSFNVKNVANDIILQLLLKSVYATSVVTRCGRQGLHLALIGAVFALRFELPKTIRDRAALTCQPT